MRRFEDQGRHVPCSPKLPRESETQRINRWQRSFVTNVINAMESLEELQSMQLGESKRVKSMKR